MNARICATCVVFVFVLSSCRTLRSDPETVMTVVNNGQAVVRNLEVIYPGGNFGAPSIAPGQSYTKSVPAKGACKLQVHFLDASNKDVPQKSVELAGNCPRTLTINIGADYSVTAQ